MKKKLPLILGGIVLLLAIAGVTVFCLFQYTEVFGKKIIPLNIKSVSIQYVPGYDLDTVATYNEKEEVLPIQNIKLSGKDLTSFKGQVSKIRENKVKTTTKILHHYNVVINDNVTVEVGDGMGYVLNGKRKKEVIIPNSTMNAILSIIEKNNKKILKNLTTENVTLKLEGSSISVKNEDNLKYIKESLSYYPISIKEEYKNYQGGYKVEMVLDNNVKVYFYESGIGYISQKDGETDTSTYAIFIDNVYELAEQIYKVSVE